MLTFAGDGQWREVELDEDAVSGIRQWWNDHMRELAARMPAGPWADRLLPAGTTNTANIREAVR